VGYILNALYLSFDNLERVDHHMGNVTKLIINLLLKDSFAYNFKRSLNFLKISLQLLIELGA
jgi:hypothetical protein